MTVYSSLWEDHYLNGVSSKLDYLSEKRILKSKVNNLFLKFLFKSINKRYFFNRNEFDYEHDRWPLTWGHLMNVIEILNQLLIEFINELSNSSNNILAIKKIDGPFLDTSWVIKMHPRSGSHREAKRFFCCKKNNYKILLEKIRF